ncbi:copper resistance protein CopC [Paenibacillus sp. LHD-38]|uniref:copper resistance CopC/CopD family protein n=1 Tax=Paenibacillus sp. LHD-38 TaxID=3072143 RepID=UPI00280EFD63|nr:copper resistance protein CopC [Paenibacillus sp. LHD-38]MDQ8739122.1 copper resistance protein CopC [Paenibacillus sp. LHD-38]
MLKRLIFLFVIFILIPISVAHAHSPIEKRNPNVNAVLESVPLKVDLYFKDPVQIHRSSVIVRDEKKTEVQIGKPQIDPNDNRHIYIDLQKDLSSGTYYVDIDVVAMDGHSLNEKYSFEIKMALSTPDEMFERLELVRTFPSDGTIVDVSPNKIELWFNEPIEMRFFGLLNDKQQIVPTNKPVVDPADPKHFILELESELPAGTYSIQSYPSIGENTGIHIVYFAVKEFTSITSDGQLSLQNEWGQSGILQVIHWLSYFGLLSLFGGTLFQLIIAKNNGNLLRWRIISNALFGFCIASLLLEMFIYKMQHPNVILNDFLRFNTVWISLLQISLVAVSLAIKKFRLILLLLSLLGFAFTGHSADPSYGGFLAIGLDSIHLLTTSIWIGGLVALFAMLPKESPLTWLKETGKTFSRWALLSFVGTGVTGIFMSLSYVPSFSAVSIIESNWGQMMLIKVLLYLIIILFGIWQRRLLVKLTEKLIFVFYKNIKIEVGIAIVILFFTGILVDLSPEEALQGISPRTQTISGVTAKVDAYPLKPGGNDITIQLSDDTDVQSVKVNLQTSLGSLGTNQAFYLGDGLYKVTGNLLHTAGIYNMEVEVIKKSGETIQYPPFTLQVPGPMPNEIVIEKEG